jgi:hypothetical protein
MAQQDESTLGRLGILAPARNNSAPRAVWVVIDGLEVLLHKLSHLERLAYVLAFRQTQVLFAPRYVALSAGALALVSAGLRLCRRHRRHPTAYAAHDWTCASWLQSH